jgi:PKD repeat protein
MKIYLLRTAAIAALIGVTLFVPGTASAAPPAQDDFANAIAIDQSLLPFSDSVVIDDATLESGEPSGCYFAGKSIWYSITPTSNGVLRADIGGSTFIDRIEYVYRQDGSGFGGLTTIACASPYYNGASSATFTVEAGNTYYLQVGGFFPYSTGTLNLSLQAILPPPNDDFANATAVTTVPFSDNLDLTGATTEAGEPTPSCGSAPLGTSWYAFTPTTSASYMAQLSSSAGFGFVVEYGVYTGSSLSTLTGVACHYGNPLLFHADSGTTYYIQVANAAGQANPAVFSLAVAPSPVAQFSFYPSDPSSFETIQFYDNSYDPAGAGISSEAWQFGDEATASGCCPTHRYTADGDFSVKLTVTTVDGRTGTQTQVIHVKTHDVTISRVLVPQTAKVGQTRMITVGLTNSRYPETVQVQLLKSVAGGGWQQVGVLTQYVPVRGGNRTTDFNFNYTFAPEDAVLGKVSFQAVATIQGARDAIPTDNTFISTPTRVAD